MASVSAGPAIRNGASLIFELQWSTVSSELPQITAPLPGMANEILKRLRSLFLYDEATLSAH
jgi:hypothetical protein